MSRRRPAKQRATKRDSAVASRRKTSAGRRISIVSVEPELSRRDAQALQRLIERIGNKPKLFTGTRFVFRDSVVVIERVK